MTIKTIHHQGKQFQVAGRTITIKSDVTKQLIAYLEAWQQVYPYEDNFSWRTYGVPSLYVRFDGVLQSNSFCPYEISERPGGMGYVGSFFDDFRQRRDTLKDTAWPPFSVVISPERRNHDDPLWLEEIPLQEALASNKLVNIRVGFNKEGLIENKSLYLPLQNRSVTTFETSGDKSYGVHLNWWKQVTWHQANTMSELPWDEGFALKPIRGSMSRDVFVWQPGNKGRSTRAQIIEALERHKTMYLQTYIPPMIMEIDGKLYYVILRPFFGYDPTSRSWKALHGMWTARPYPNLRIHCASDAINGPLFVEDPSWQ